MTRILAIEGTDIRLEITECSGCPFDDDERGTCNLATELMIEQPRSVADPACPLPEKKAAKSCHDPSREFDGGIPEGAEFVMCLGCGALIRL